jgi:spore coat polysaccharide biosynthesis predicted glycosyltransferase SpsG
LTKGESKKAPLPDRIITCGKIPAEILHKDGNFPHELLHEGCALRYEYLFNSKLLKRKNTKTILMAFPIGLNESIDLLRFLVKAFRATPEYRVKLKPHPSLSMNRVLTEGKIELPENFDIVKDKNMLDLFNETDVLLYSETTVCIEALMVGIPVVYIDIDSYYNKDRLFKCKHFKWIAKTENELLKVIKEIYEMDNKSFKMEQGLAREYIKNYFLPVDEKCLNSFFMK